MKSLLRVTAFAAVAAAISAAAPRRMFGAAPAFPRRMPGMAPKVNVTLYSESLCPDCIHFITGAWYDVWSTPGLGGMNGIIHWNQVVYGNAQTSGNQITCQHGPEECSMNILQSCAIDQAVGNASMWLPFIYCLETHGTYQRRYAESCAASVGYNWNKLNACWTSDQGLQLELRAGAATQALVPPHQFVPWVTIGDTPGTFCQNSNCDNFLQAVCDAYTGNKPTACQNAAASQARASLRGPVTGECRNPNL